MKTARLMFGLLCVLCMMLAGRLTAQVTGAATASTDDEKSGREVTNLVRELSQAYIKADTAKMNQLLADDWELVTMEGEIWTKENALKLFATRQLVIESEDFGDMKARVNGDTAVVTARVAGKGPGFSNEQRASYVFIRNQGRWQCIHTQGTTLHPENWTFIPRTQQAKKQRIGTYDSRAIVMAYYFSPAFNAAEGKRAAECNAEMEKAKASGDKKQVADVEARYGDLVKLQIQRHKQGFSTAPVDDILEHVKDQMQEISRAARVETVVSKWDKQALAKYKEAELVDVTIPMVYAFHPTMKMLMTALDVMTKPPVPLEKAEKIDWSKE